MIFDVAGAAYRATPLDARSQFLLLGHLTPLLPALDGVGRAVGRRGQVSVADAVAAIAPLAQAPEADLDGIMDACFATCEVRDGDGWSPAIDRLDDLDLSDALAVVAAVVALNFGAFFTRERPSFRASFGRGPRFDPVSMPQGLDWLLRPAVRGLCRYESLTDGTLGIAEVAEMNDVLDVAEENRHRAEQAAAKANA